MNKHKSIITAHIKELGIPASFSGYYFLRRSIERTIEDPSIIFEITSRLYPEVAKDFNTTASKVERCMRHAIETGWCRGNTQVQQRLFGCTVDCKKGKPTNGEFIATVADYIKISLSHRGE